MHLPVTLRPAHAPHTLSWTLWTCPESKQIFLSLWGSAWQREKITCVPQTYRVGVNRNGQRVWAAIINKFTSTAIWWWGYSLYHFILIVNIVNYLKLWEKFQVLRKNSMYILTFKFYNIFQLFGCIHVQQIFSHLTLYDTIDLVIMPFSTRANITWRQTFLKLISVPLLTRMAFGKHWAFNMYFGIQYTTPSTCRFVSTNCYVWLSTALSMLILTLKKEYAY